MENSVIPRVPPGQFAAPCSAISSSVREVCYLVLFGHLAQETLKNP